MIIPRFVVVDSEKSAVAAVEALRQRTLHDAPVRARVKNESYLKNLMKMLNTNAEGIPSEFVVPTGTQPMMFMSYPNQSMMMAFPQGPVFNQSMMANAFVEPYVFILIKILLLFIVNQTEKVVATVRVMESIMTVILV